MSRAQNQKTVTVKAILIGDPAVGKTSIVKRYTEGGFPNQYNKTIGVDFDKTETRYNINSNKFKIKWILWHFGGANAFDRTRASYYEGVKAALLVFDISRPKTYQNMYNWVQELLNNMRGLCPLVLIGNKADLRDKKNNTVPKRMGEKFANTLEKHTGCNTPYIETSAKENKNIDKIFTHLEGLIPEWISDNSS